jgi:hypothetical protein
MEKDLGLWRGCLRWICTRDVWLVFTQVKDIYGISRLIWVGYIGRVLMHSNPWSDPGFKLDLVCIILAPTLICAGIYLTLKHVARTVGPDFSRITPRLYTWIFIPFDVFCLCLQGVGGGVDAAASDKTPVDAKTLKTGNDIIIAGIALQVVNLAVFGLFSLDFFIAARKHFKNPSEKVRNSVEAQIWYSRRFRVFCSAIACAYAGILVRCIYRYVFSFPLICYDMLLMIY